MGWGAGSGGHGANRAGAGVQTGVSEEMLDRELDGVMYMFWLEVAKVRVQSRCVLVLIDECLPNL